MIKQKGEVSAYLDCTFDGGTTTESYPQGSTVRHSKCNMIVQKGHRVCRNCKQYRKSLIVMAIAGPHQVCQQAHIYLLVYFYRYTSHHNVLTDAVPVHRCKTNCQLAVVLTTPVKKRNVAVADLEFLKGWFLIFFSNRDQKGYRDIKFIHYDNSIH